MRRFVHGAATTAAVSLAGWREGALSGRGAVAATGVGTGITVGSSWPGLVVLGTFFISSSALSHRNRQQVETAKGSRRDERQVLANGLVAAGGSLAAGRAYPAAGLALAAGALSAATADTWAPELGAASRKAPRLWFSGRAVARGTSGGVTLRGSLGSLAGATTIASLSGLLVGLNGTWAAARWIGPGVLVAGLAGGIVDSLLGELAQERRHCPVCQVRTEAPIHHCGHSTDYAGGIEGVDNDLVNLACTLTGGLVMVPFLVVARRETAG
jgi:uncharacterized protein (TIGR00297 family)